MPRLKKGDIAYFPRLNDWFADALMHLNKCDLLSAFPEENGSPPAAGAAWLNSSERYDIQAVMALIQLCSTFQRPREALVDLLCDPYHLTVIEAHDEALIGPLQNALEAGLLAAMRRKFDHLPKVSILSPLTAGHSQNPERRRAAFETALQESLGDQWPVISLVESVEQLPEIARTAATHVVSVSSLNRQMVLKLFSVIHGKQDPADLVRAFKTLPFDVDLARMGPEQVAISVRKGHCQDMVETLVKLSAQARTKAKPGALAEVKGLGASRAMLEQIGADMRAWANGTLNWSEIPRGLLLYGPPGTGKTFAAQKLAEDVGCHFVATSYADWQKAGHLGDFHAAMSSSFKEARDHAPSILFIDEVDSFGDRTTASGDNAGYIRSAVNGLLEQLDGAVACEGVLVIAACNIFETLDAALIRSGRFDMKIPMLLPDKPAMEDILQSHVGEDVCAGEVGDVAAHLVGRSGADAAAVVRRARSLARRKHRLLVRGDLLSAAQLMVPAASSRDLRRAAIHEAGHAVVGFLLGNGVPVSAEIRAQGGVVQFRRSSHYPTQADLEAELSCLLGGRTAEQVILQNLSVGSGGGAQSDLAQATKLAARIEMQFGFGHQGLVWRHVTEETLPELLENEDLRDRISCRLDAAEHVAIGLVSGHRDLVQTLADALMSRRQLSGDDLANLLNPSQSEPAMESRVLSRIPSGTDGLA